MTNRQKSEANDSQDIFQELIILKKENESLKTSLDNSLTKISQLEEELKRSKKYLDESRHFGHVGNWHWSLESNELRWLDEVDNINGQDPKQPNSPLAEMSIYYTPESWEKLNETVKKSSATSDSYELELEMIRPDGKIIHTITSGTADYSSAGKLLNLYGMVRDITARGKSEETLQWNQSLLQLMSNTSPLGLLVVDNRTDNILYFNTRFCEIWGILHLAERIHLGELKNSDIISDCLPALVDVPAFIESNRPLQDEENRIIIEDEIAFGGMRTIRRYSAQIRGAQDEYYGRYYIFEDITERKCADDEIRRTNKELVKLNSEKDKFFSIISHDLQSPFQGFLGLTEILADEAESFSAGELTEFGKNMNRTADSLFKLLKNLLDWAQMQKGTMRFLPKEFSLDTLIEEVVQAHTNWSNQKGITIINLASQSLNVFADEKMINSVLINVLSNAIKFTRRGGSITIKAFEKEHNAIDISVSDNGVGIQQGDLEKLFVVGEKTRAIGTDGELGNGLGLLLSKSFVEKNKGTISVVSVPGSGSTFTISLSNTVDAEK